MNDDVNVMIMHVNVHPRCGNVCLFACLKLTSNVRVLERNVSMYYLGVWEHVLRSTDGAV